MSATIPDLAREVMQLRQHIAWLHGTLDRLGDMRPLVSTIDLPTELTGRIDYARHVKAASLRRYMDLGVADRPPSLAALIVGQALAQPAEERDMPAHHAASPRRPGWAMAWCSFDGQIHVGQAPPPDDVWLAEGRADVLCHWIEELAVRGEGTLAGTWWVPHFRLCASVQQRAEAAINFAGALAEAGRTILPIAATSPRHLGGKEPA